MLAKKDPDYGFIYVHPSAPNTLLPKGLFVWQSDIQAKKNYQHRMVEGRGLPKTQDDVNLFQILQDELQNCIDQKKGTMWVEPYVGVVPPGEEKERAVHGITR